MFFSRQDYLKIQEWLRRNAIKDTDFQDASSLEGKETLAIVQNGQNVKVSLSDFAEQLYLLGIPDFINATDRYDVHSIEDAIKSIPSKSIKKGQVITFIDNEGEWKIYQFQGKRLNQWNIISLWADVIKESLQGFVPDDEDLIALNGIVKFKNKVYDPDNFSGKGRVYLRKNIVTLDSKLTINLLTQQMIGKEDTIYVVLYDYNLNGQTITIPNNCTLLFEGGSFSNGTIILNHTKIAPNGLVISDYISAGIQGSYAVGLCKFDISLNKPIWWTGSKWVDATGANV